MNIETKGLGAGSYPEPIPNDEYKCYKFTAECSAKLKGYVYAHSKEEAQELIENGKEDEIEETIDLKIENITEMKEVKD